MYNFKTKLEAFGRGFANCESPSKSAKIAAGVLMQAKEGIVEIDTDLGLCYIRHEGCYLQFASSAACGDMDYLAERYPDEAEDFLYIKEKFSDQLGHTNCQFNEIHTQSRTDWLYLSGWWMGHAVPDFAGMASNGTDFYREKIEKYRKINEGKDEFYDSLVTVLDAFDIFGKRFYDLADEMLKEETDPKKVRYLETIRRTFDHAPKKPCRDFAEAVIVFTMVFSFDGIDSPGHFDQYMYDFWKVTDPAIRREYLENLWEYFHNVRAWNLCISGSDENWNDLSNDLTYEILEVTKKFKYQTPNLTLRYHRNTPEKLLHAAYEALATGCGLPALYNDEVVCPALERLGIPPCDSHLYVMNGCNQIDIQGKSHMGLEDGHVCMAAPLELALSNGISPKSGKLLGLETGDPASFDTYEKLYRAYEKQLDHLVKQVCDMSNESQRIWAAEAPNPYRCIFIEGCVEKGIDYKAGGPLYGHGQILLETIADAADSLAAIKKYVYEEKRFTLTELIDALKNNFEGYDEMYRTLKFSELKFGNDIDYVDSIAAQIVDRANSQLLTYPTVRGGYFSGGCSPFTSAPIFGRARGALPNGKKDGEHIIADSIGATPGCDTNGPTALINSCLKFDHTLPGSGFILNLKFDKDIFTSKKGEDAFLSVCKTYFTGGGQMLTFTVISAEELLDAQKNPENHRDLIVRVGGYSDYFINIGESLQENVIARTVLKV